MAENCSSMEACAYRPSFPKTSSWMTEVFSRENEALTKALQISLADDSSVSEALPLPSLSAELESAARRGDLRGTNLNRIPSSPSGKITKRKSRASKRSPTTYINADPANFRRMVQEVTGVRLSESGLPVEPMPKPRAHLTGISHSGQAQAYLPTLDTSDLLLGRPGMVGEVTVSCGSFEPVADGPVYDFEPFPSFPTLESWGIQESWDQ
ncbi:hypothetical protein HPP92_013875 [Vanilla planifolia]|uniref:VQ domain-containing protein n=1 Tax=Vanilla planifolia TaxID=51239 RepID=A0A835V113_VANPL|nr:hypothetical protein HPP92_013875 [Vanilla planifolia]